MDKLNNFACADVPDNFCTGNCSKCTLVGNCLYCDCYQLFDVRCDVFRCFNCIYNCNFPKSIDKADTIYSP